MSTTIDQRVVEMRFDNSRFEKNVSATMSTLDKLRQSLKLPNASDSLQGVSEAARRVDLSSLASGVEKIQSRFSALGIMGVTALQNITNSAINTGKRIASALTIDPIKTGFQEYETQINAVQTILANTESKGTTLQDVNRALDTLNTYADKTIYNFTEMTRNIGTFTAAGVDLDTSVKSIQGIANLAAVSGSTSQQASTAMYQLSQALAAGKVSLMDWNSVVNAGMGGEVFQNALKRTAKSLGTNVDAMIKKYGSFRESLTKGQWLTTEVLTKTLEQFTMSAEEGTEQWEIYKKSLMDDGYTASQAEEILKLANTATNAATKVKTFTQLWDTLKESAQSGWTQTWEIIVGDFEDAKKFLTNISDTIGPMISATADARNKVLSGGLSSGWDQLLEQGIADEEGYIETVKSVAEEHGVAIDEMIKKEGSFEKALVTGLKNGDISSEMLSTSVTRLADKIRGMSEEELKAAGYTKEHLTQIEALESGLKKGSISMDEFVDKMKKPSGRENLIDSLWNTFNAVLSIITPVKEAFREIFPPATAEQLYKLTENLKNFTEKLKLSDNASNNLKRTFKGVFAILDIVKQVFTAAAKAIFPLFSGLDNLGGGILDVTASWGDWLVRLDETVKKTDILNTVFQGASNFIKTIVKAISDFAKTIKDKFNFPGLEIFHGILERISNRMAAIKEASYGMKSGVVVAIEAMGEALANCNFIKLMQSLWNGIKTIASGLSKALNALTEGLAEKIGNADFDGIFDLINTISFASIGVFVAKFVKGFSDITESVGSFKESAIGILDEVKGCLEAYQTQLKAGSLTKIATAIGILAASILVISLIDSEKLSASLGAITVLFADLMTSMAIFGKISGSLSGVTKACTAMMGISVAVLVLASALKKISGLDPEEMTAGIIGVASLTTIVVAAAKVLGSGNKTVIKGAMQMVIFASAIKILSSVCKDLSALNPEELAKGLVGVGVLLAEVSLFMKTAKFSGKSITTATGIVILSSAIKVLASACSDFATMSWESIGKGLAAIGGLLTEISLFTNLTGNAKHVISTGVSLVLIGAAMKVFASACSDFATMSWESIGKGLTVLAGSLAAVTLALNLMPNNMIVISAGLLAVSAALVVISNVVVKMGDMGWESIAKGLVALGGSIAILAIGLHAMNGTIAGSAAILIASAALAVLTPVLLALGSMSWESIAKGLITIAGAFAILGIAGAVLTPLVPTILALSGSIALLGVGVLGIGAGLLAIGAGLSTLAIGISALGTSLAAGATAIVAGLTVIVTGVASLIPMIVTKIGEAIVSFCEVIAESAPAIGKAIKAVILSLLDVLKECIPNIVDSALLLILEVCSSLTEYTPKIVDVIFKFLIGVLDGIAKNLPTLIQSAVNVFMSFFSGIIDALKGIDTGVLIKGILGVGLLAGIMAALAAVAGLVPGAMVGVLGMGLVIAELALMLAAIGALAQIPGLEWLINEGGQLLQSVGSAIGSFIGGIVGGFMSGVSSQFPKIAEDLSLFMTNLKPFIEGAKNLDGGSMEGVKALAGVILALTAANVIDGLTSWFTGGSSLSKFGEELVPFGRSMAEFSKTVSGNIDETAVLAAANAGKILAEMAATLPNSGGVVGWFTGENDMSAFAPQLETFGKAIVTFSKTVSGNIDEAAVASAANAGKILAEMATTLPNTGGVVGWFTGENDIGAFSTELLIFGSSIVAFSKIVSGNIDEGAISAAASAGKIMSEMATTLPNTGGVVAWFTGENDLVTFGTQLKVFGRAMVDFSKTVSEGIDIKAINTSVNAAKALSKLTDGMDNSGGMVSWFAGDNDLETFGDNVVKFGKSLKKYSEEVSGINTTSLSTAITNLRSLANVAKEIANVDSSGLGDFAESLGKVSKTGIDKFIKAFENADTKVSNAAKKLVETLIEAIKYNYDKFTTSGTKAIEQFSKGIDKSKADIKKTITSMLTNIVDTIKNKQTSFYDAGCHLVKGFANGISDNEWRAEAKARAMAQAAIEAAKEELDENSPSKVFYKIGDFAGLGFVNALSDYADKAYKASGEMAASARSGLSKAIGKISDLINSDIDTQPTIRPVLDLSDIRSGAGTINGLLNTRSSVGVLSNVGVISTTMRTRQNETNSDIVSAIDKLRRDVGNMKLSSYNINGISYDRGSEVGDAIETLVRALNIERRS